MCGSRFDRRFVQRWRNYQEFVQPLMALLQIDPG
jgi:hypothetical protein